MWPFALTGVVLVAGGAAAAVVLLLHPFGNSHPKAAAHGKVHHSASRPLSVSATTPSVTNPSSALPTSGSPTEQQAAQSLAGLLGQSVSDRDAIVSAVNDVSSCGPSLNQDVQTFQNAASSRQQLLSQLATLTDSSALPAQMMQSLTGAWQASVEADQDFAKWAQDEMTQGCTPNDHADPGYQAATGPDDQATADKASFAGAWDPIANQYGLTAYQGSQL